MLGGSWPSLTEIGGIKGDCCCVCGDGPPTESWAKLGVLNFEMDTPSICPDCHSLAKKIGRLMRLGLHPRGYLGTNQP